MLLDAKPKRFRFVSFASQSCAPFRHKPRIKTNSEQKKYEANWYSARYRAIEAQYPSMMTRKVASARINLFQTIHFANHNKIFAPRLPLSRCACAASLLFARIFPFCRTSSVVVKSSHHVVSTTVSHLVDSSFDFALDFAFPHRLIFTLCRHFLFSQYIPDYQWNELQCLLRFFFVSLFVTPFVSKSDSILLAVFFVDIFVFSFFFFSILMLSILFILYLFSLWIISIE